jgi:hypothetical protein
VDGVTNDTFCAAGTLQNLEVVQGGCYQLDHTAPDDIDNIETSSTSSSILVKSHAYDAGSGIKSYEYFISSDGSTYNSVSCEKDKNVCLINNLKYDTKYYIKVTVTNNNNLPATSKPNEISTSKLKDIAITIDPSGDTWAKPKTVTITYPTTDGATLTYFYFFDADDSNLTSASAVQTVNVTKNGTITAIVKDGSNTVASQVFTISKVDTEAPVITVAAHTSNYEITIGATNDYIIPSYTVTDNSGTIKNSDVQSNYVANTVGTYTVIYTATDNSNNSSSLTLTITVVDPIYSDWTTTDCASQWHNCQSKTQYKFYYYYSENTGQVSAGQYEWANWYVDKTATANFSETSNYIDWFSWYFGTGYMASGHFYSYVTFTDGTTYTYYDSGNIYTSNYDQTGQQNGSYSSSPKLMKSITVHLICNRPSYAFCTGYSWAAYRLYRETDWQDSSTATVTTVYNTTTRIVYRYQTN